MLSDDLLDIARRLAVGATQADLRRAVSSVYYAVFHEVCQSSADTLVGDDPQDRDQSAWRQAYRALEHGYARQRCQQVRRSGRFSTPIQNLADFFVTMQNSRHLADYDPEETFSQHEISTDIAQAEAVIRDFRNVLQRERRAFAVFLLMRERQD